MEIEGDGGVAFGKERYSSGGHPTTLLINLGHSLFESVIFWILPSTRMMIANLEPRYGWMSGVFPA